MNAHPSPLPQLAEDNITDTQAAPQVGPITGRPLTAESPQAKKSASAFRTISEVADELDVQQHVLRFWETKFSQIRPLKRGGGRRYYRPEDVELLKTIHKLLYGEGYTIKGVQKLFRDKGKNQVIEKTIEKAIAQPRNSNEQSAPVKSSALNEKQRAALEAVADELRALRNLIVPAA